jgi:hypothetical protein
VWRLILRCDHTAESLVVHRDRSPVGSVGLLRVSSEPADFVAEVVTPDRVRTMTGQ